MTDDTRGTGSPADDGSALDRFGPETPGPDATPEQAAYVAGLLGSLRADDPAIPDHVATRVDAVLAELRRTEPVTPGAARALTDPDDPSPAPGRGTASGPADEAAAATVLPMPARRESTTTRTFRWVAGAAAAIVVVGAGAAVVRGGMSGSSSSSGGAAVTAADSSGERGAAPIRTSGTDYSSASLAAQAQALVAKETGDGVVAPQAPEGSPEVAPTASARNLLTDATLAACLDQLTQGAGATPVAVDQGSFEGKPADVVVLPSPDDPTRLEVWVIGPGCTRESAQLYEFRTIPSPGAGGAASPGTEASDQPAPATSPGTGTTP